MNQTFSKLTFSSNGKTTSFHIQYEKLNRYRSLPVLFKQNMTVPWLLDEGRAHIQKMDFKKLSSFFQAEVHPHFIFHQNRLRLRFKSIDRVFRDFALLLRKVIFIEVMARTDVFLACIWHIFHKFCILLANQLHIRNQYKKPSRIMYHSNFFENFIFFRKKSLRSPPRIDEKVNLLKVAISSGFISLIVAHNYRTYVQSWQYIQRSIWGN